MNLDKLEIYSARGNGKMVEALKEAYKQGRTDVLKEIRSITNDILIKCDIDGYRPIKNTSKKDCYEALYKIMYLLRYYKE